MSGIIPLTESALLQEDVKADALLIDWLKDKVSLVGYTEELWTSEHVLIASDFLVNAERRKLVMYIDNNALHMHVTTVPPLKKVKALQYFLKFSENTTLTPVNISQEVQFGTMHGGAMDSLLHVMNGVYLPTFLSNETWPESVRKQFSAQLHKFMASLTETANQAQGHTVLYIPAEGLGDPETSAMDKDLIQRLESTLIHWTRQIKEVVSNQETSQNVDNCGPLEEIEFWRSRCLDLSGIRNQLNRPGVNDIVQVLKYASSTYLISFESLSDKIGTGSAEAKDNLTFLGTLQEPCQRLAEASPNEIPSILPEILNRIRMIWTISEYYNSDERLTGLLRKVSNQIIVQCSAKIDLHEIFDGDVLESMVQLRASIDCGKAWHAAYDKVVSAIQKDQKTSGNWDFDPSTHGIFAQIDAFVQRCHNLMEVCEGQLQFARKGTKKDGVTGRAPLPAFGGTRGSEIEKSMYEIEDQFEKQIEALRKLDYDILNVKATDWHYDYNNFKNGLKDLEMMMSNVITSAWEGVATIEGGIHVLEAFHFLAVRPGMVQVVEKKTAELYQRFSSELKRVKTEFDMHKKDPPLPLNHPRFAGRALWAKMLLVRVETDHEHLEKAYYLPRVTEKEDAENAYNQLVKSLEGQIAQCHGDWVGSMQQASGEKSNLGDRLQNKLMKRSEYEAQQKPGQQQHTILSRSQAGYLESDFDKYLLRLFAEVRYWEKFHGDHPIPYMAHEMYSQQGQLRVLRELVMLVIRDYNTIIDALSPEERKLFFEHLRQVDRKIQPGLNKLSWADKHIKDWFVRVSRQKCQEVYRIVMAFKENNQRINQQCRTIASTMLVDIEKNTIYEDVNFEQKQMQHQAAVRRTLAEAHADIIATVKASKRFFYDHPKEIQKQWDKYVKKIDLKVERALKTTAKKSLQDLSRAINGDVKSKSEPHPLFKVNMILDDGKGAVEFRPSMNNLSDMIKNISKQSLTTMQVIPRVADVLLSTDKSSEVKFAEDGGDSKDVTASDGEDEAEALSALSPEAYNTFYKTISADKEVLKVLSDIIHGTTAVALGLAKIIEHYEKAFQHIWSNDKAAFIRRYAHTRRPLASFDVDIQRYRHHQEDVQHEDSMHTVIFIRVDCTSLKQSLVAHCQQWQLKLTTLLHENATTELNSLNNLFVENSAKLRRVPETLDELKENVELWEKTQNESPQTEARFEPIEDTYRCLDRFDVNYGDEEKEMLDNLRVAWGQFQQTLNVSSKMLEEKKEEMKRELDDNLRSFNQHVTETRSEFKERGPFSAPGPDEGNPENHIESALEFIAEFRKRIGDNRGRVDSMRMGLELFKIDPPDYKELDDTEKELDVLERVWKMMEEWFREWNAWKLCVFSELQVGDMEAVAKDFQARLSKMSRGVKQWKVWESLHSLIQRFRSTMPLVGVLRSPAMRERHWVELQQEMSQTFDPNGDDFTLNKLINLGIHMHSEAIMGLNVKAQRQLNIENSLKDIAATWAKQELELVPYKQNKYFKIRSVEQVNDLLENHQLLLSTMKNSPYYLTFAKDVNLWTRNLNDMVETLEMITTVQRQWMYLESIFMDSVDIRKQLPKESTLFETVNNQWIDIMNKLYEARLVTAVLNEGLLDRLVRMNETLDRINHSLDQYLETKRQLFPRFYFLANDDLLQILGHARDPLMVQRHISKFFAGVAALDLIPPNRSTSKVYEVVGAVSDDGEEVKFHSAVRVDGEVEQWLKQVEDNITQRLQQLLQTAVGHTQKANYRRTALEPWIKSSLGQLLITSGQISWTAKCETALLDPTKAKRFIKRLKKDWQDYLTKLSKCIRDASSKRERLKLNALITIEVHARDVIDRLKVAAKSKVTKSSFEWQSQLRFYWVKETDFANNPGRCLIKQTNTVHDYGYEYQGNTGRLVVTPLTDRCYLTLTTALALCLGGNPQGPAGTGKTETVKDLGKGLGKFNVVFNCSPKMNVMSLGRNFSGLAQTGAWGCFDEFNRILIEVLSVVSLQVSSILDAVKSGLNSFNFMGSQIALDRTVGIFITMNPGYAGRTALPDNLSALFRPIAMMVPDTQMISEIILLSVGFKEYTNLAKKVCTIYKLMEQQLSKQSHYSFDLRAVKSVLMRAGAIQRSSHDDMGEEHILMRALKDMNLSKLHAEDVFLFDALIADIFLNMELPSFEYPLLMPAIQGELKDMALVQHAPMVGKMLQLYECMRTRHGNMLVGQSLSGKTESWRVLSRALTACSEMKGGTDAGFRPVDVQVLNPKALSVDQLYGSYNLATKEWSAGVLAEVLSEMCAAEDGNHKWLLLDGPVDTLWIESMNSLLDDNKVLTLTNGDRISIPNTVSVLFEVLDLSVASPATVSRCGMIYYDHDLVGWEPYVQTWIAKKMQALNSVNTEVKENQLSSLIEKKKTERPVWTKDGLESVSKLFEKYVVPALAFKREAQDVKELIPVSEIASVHSLCRMFDSVCTVANGVDPTEDANYYRMLEMWFSFSVIWSIGASFDAESRKRFDVFFRDLEAQFPPLQTCYEYYVDSNKKDWTAWGDRVNTAWVPTRGVPFHKLLVPTIDTVRYTFIIKSLIARDVPTLIVGSTGTGKTAVISSVLGSTDASEVVTLTINFSAASSSDSTQEMIESRLEKRQRTRFGPVGARSKLVVFVDDLNMPKKDEYGSQGPLELLRQWLEHRFWYDREKIFAKEITGTQIVAAMGPPGGARSPLSTRFASKFNQINFCFPQDAQVRRIFRALITDHLTMFDESVKPLAQVMTQASLELFKQVSDDFLPTPARCHYLFNMRDISAVFQGVLRSNPRSIDTREAMIKLWCHETLRVFYDRLVNDDDREKFIDMLNTKLHACFDVSWAKLFPDDAMPVFADFLDDDGPSVISAENNAEHQAPYQEVTLKMDKVKAFMEEKLDLFNEDIDNIRADLVLFDQAVHHVARIYRIIRQERGSAMLIGMGGSGRQSLTRLAAYLAGYTVKQISPGKNYRLVDFREDMKDLYKLAGMEQERVVFLFSDTQIVHPAFLEDINNMLQSGEIPKLFAPDELTPILEELRQEAMEENIEVTSNEFLYQYFIGRVRQRLHIVLCMSPVGVDFRNRCRMFPALVNNTTMDWFSKWPEAALRAVAAKFLGEVDVGDDRMVSTLADVFCANHMEVQLTSDAMAAQAHIMNYITPTKYLDLVKGYAKLLHEKRGELGDKADKLRGGLSKFDKSRELVKSMTVELEESKKVVAQKKIQCDKLVVEIIQKQRAADEQKKQVEVDTQRAQEETLLCEKIQDEAKAELEKVTPALEKAVLALSRLTKSSVTEVKSYKQPPKAVEKVLSAVMVVLGKETGWLSAKKELTDPTFLKRLENFDKDNISNSTLKQMGKYTRQKDFNVDDITKISHAAGALCDWVCAMELYAKVFRDVEPRRQALRKAEAKLLAKQEELAASQQQLNDVIEKVTQLEQLLRASEADKSEYQRIAQELESKLNRAASLVESLTGERVRWEKSVEVLLQQLKHVVGDCTIAASFVAYGGPFPITYRQHLLKRWVASVRKFNVIYTSSYSHAKFLAAPTQVMEWNIQGLPSDDHSTENGILVTRGMRWPLMIDPQSQANMWIKVKDENLKVTDLQTPNFMKFVEVAMSTGRSILIQDVGEELDPSLEPILRVDRLDKKMSVVIGDRELHFDPEFRLYFTTKLSNPVFKPELSVKTTVINFAVVEEGLQDQLLSVVVKYEEPKLENDKEDLIKMIAAGKRQIDELEDKILTMLKASDGNLLDDVELIETLQASKAMSEEVKENLAVASVTEKKIDAARKLYWPCAVRAALCFFVLCDLGSVDPMYQFSLKAYMELFQTSIRESKENSSVQEQMDLSERIETLNVYHTEAVYKYGCMALFERHKLLFAFKLCVEKLKSDNSLDEQEYNFLLRGGQIMDRSLRPGNPCEWLSEESWDNIVTLDQLPEFKNLAHTFETNGNEWKAWYLSETPPPERLQTPDWGQNKRDDFQQLLILRCMRMDRVVYAARSYIAEGIGPAFVESPEFDLNDVYKQSTPLTPLIYVLSPGVDPTQGIVQLANKLERNVKILPLGQGQAQEARKLLEDGARNGTWVFLANCHLSISWLPELAALVEKMSLQAVKPHKNFRLWLSCDPCLDFPISLLQNGIKMTTEPPKGIRANMLRTYNMMSDDDFERCQQAEKYSKLVFALAYFHAVVIERKKFLNLGWNTAYQFNDSDFNVCENILALYLDDYDDTPWDALKYLIAQANYGGRVTDSQDRTLLTSYINQFFCEAAISQPKFPLCSLDGIYYIPDEVGDLPYYRKFISKLPRAEDDPPEAFGQHANADIARRREEARSLLGILLSMQPKEIGSTASSADEKMLDSVLQLQESVPLPLGVETYQAKFDVDKTTNPLVIVLLQEISRYDKLLTVMHEQFEQLVNGLKGAVVISSDMEEVVASMYAGKVPEAWSFAYPSTKTLGPWARELTARIQQLRKWADDGVAPKVFWLGGFTFPTGFLTALFQHYARKNGVGIDDLSWDFQPQSTTESNINNAPKEGAYIKGLYLEGARWEMDNQTLAEAYPTELTSPMPIVYFKPVHQSKRSGKGLHKTPLFIYPVREGTISRASFMLEVELKTGAHESAYWTRRGVALLLTLGDSG